MDAKHLVGMSTNRWLLIAAVITLVSGCQSPPPPGYHYAYETIPGSFECYSSGSYSYCGPARRKRLVREWSADYATHWEGNGNVCTRQNGTSPWSCFSADSELLSSAPPEDLMQTPVHD